MLAMDCHSQALIKQCVTAATMVSSRIHMIPIIISKDRILFKQTSRLVCGQYIPMQNLKDIIVQ